MDLHWPPMPIPQHIPTHLRRAVAAVVVAAIAVVAGGCAGTDGSASDPARSTASVATTVPAPQPTTNPEGPTRQVTVYFADADATRLIAESRRVPRSTAALRGALVELARGPQGAGIPALPAGTVIVGTDIRGGVAYVNLSGAFTAGYPAGGAAAEFAVLAPLVYTATAVPGVQQVRLTVDGLTPSPSGSQYDWSRAFARTDFPGAGPG